MTAIPPGRKAVACHEYDGPRDGTTCLACGWHRLDHKKAQPGHKKGCGCGSRKDIHDRLHAEPTVSARTE